MGQESIKPYQQYVGVYKAISPEDCIFSFRSHDFQITKIEIKTEGEQLLITTYKRNEDGVEFSDKKEWKPGKHIESQLSGSITVRGHYAMEEKELRHMSCDSVVCCTYSTVYNNCLGSKMNLDKYGDRTQEYYFEGDFLKLVEKWHSIEAKQNGTEKDIYTCDLEKIQNETVPQ